MSHPAELTIGSLEEAAYKRRERLKSLKRKYQETGKVAPATSKQTPTDSIANDDDESDQPASATENVVSTIEDELDALKEPLLIEDIDITNLAPRKPDWDLKRDVAKKLEILDKRTQRAIAELIRDRLKSNQETVDLQAVNVLSGFSSQK